VPTAETDRLATIRNTLEAHGQSHLLAGLEQLSPSQQDDLLNQLQAIDFDALRPLIEQYVLDAAPTCVPDDLEPAPYYPHDPSRRDDYDPATFRAAGEELIREGAVAAFTVAGGQGTRLGWNGPKGTYPATVVTDKPLFRVFAEQILATQNKYGVTIPWYIMTSPMNHADTLAFFADNNNFGLVRSNIFMFPQGVMPSMDARTGNLLLAGPHALAVNPDGHGGSFTALKRSGALEDMRSRGIRHISYFQIDNPLARAIDPLFLGLHAAAPDSSAEMSSKMVPKTAPEEKVGVFCLSDGRTIVIEYSDLPEHFMHQRTEDGSLAFNAGSIAIHLISVDFVDKITSGDESFSLPFHRAVKKVISFDSESAQLVEPNAPNAVKLETFVFDAIPLAESSIVCETSRQEEFAPIKNGSGVDSIETAHQLQSDRAGAWLESRGVTVPRDAEGHICAKIEISPLTAQEPADLESVAELPQKIEPGEELAI